MLEFNRLVEQSKHLLRTVVAEDISLIVHLDRQAGCVKADAAQLEQVILNLALNARDAVATGGALTIKTAKVVVDLPTSKRNPGLSPGIYVRLTVSDTGSGMAPEVLPHIFEPFFTTKEAGKGSGLGLAAAYGIVKQAGGWIGVQSEPGKGSTFSVYLPRVEAAPTGVQAGRVAPSPIAGTETVLLVEDEGVVLRLAQEILRESGYRVLSATDGAAALRLLAESRAPLHLLVTDVVMTGMSGPELAWRVREFAPEARVLYISGYIDDAVLYRKGLPEDAAILQKPFTPEQFVRTVRDALEGKWSPSLSTVTSPLSSSG